MGKSYDLSKSSDMNRLSKDLKSSAMQQVNQALMSRKYEINCPFCNGKISVPPGRSACPLCLREINLELDIH